jgi:hypothetical protein
MKKRASSEILDQNEMQQFLLSIPIYFLPLSHLANHQPTSLKV